MVGRARLGGGDVRLITVETQDPSAESAFVTRAMPVIESMTFAP